MKYYGAAAVLLMFVPSVHAITPGSNWLDSYSVDGQCYCISTYDHDADLIVVETPAGSRTVIEICDAIGPGPGVGVNPIYNDLQCGNGPPNSALDEELCPGRVDMGEAGCSIIGPTWNLEKYFPDPNPEPEPEPEPETNPEPVSQVVGTPIELMNEPGDILSAAVEFATKDDRWILIDTGEGGGETGMADPDEPHDTGVLNGQYLELLPDSRVSESDPEQSDNTWVGNEGPQVHFNLTFESAGKYQVFVRLFSTGPFDDKISVGYDDLWSDSANVLTTCGVRGAWTWSDCENVEPIILDIASAGVHSIQFSALADGLEFDQFVLRKLESDDSESEASPELGEAVSVGGNGVAFGSGWFGWLSVAMLMCLGLVRNLAGPARGHEQD